MQITLKQSDIEKSLKDYITSQGIRTEGKQVQIVFTAGRRGAGVTAEISIEDSVSAVSFTEAISDERTNPTQAVLSSTPEITEGEPANEPEAVPVKSVSLFG